MATDPSAVPAETPLALVRQMQAAIDGLREQVMNPRSSLDAADRAVIARKIPDLAEDLATLYRFVSRSEDKPTEAAHVRL